MDSRVVLHVLLSLSIPICSNLYAREHPSALDSTGRMTFEFNEPVPFGQTNAIAEITVEELFEINDVDVSVDISHTWDGDIQLILESPDGTQVMLFDQLGGMEDNLSETEFNDQAELSIESGAPPYAGSYQPVEELAAFNGESGTGVWTLYLNDVYPWVDDGTLNWWTLTLGDRIGGVIEGRVTALSDGLPLEGVLLQYDETSYSATTDAEGFYSLMGPEGTYTLSVTYPYWCGQSVAEIKLTNLDTTEMNFELGKPEAVVSRSSLNALGFVEIVENIVFDLNNAGNCGLEWIIVTETPWMSVTPHGGTLGGSETQEITVSFSADGLTPGDYVGSLDLTHNGEGSPYRMPVFLTVVVPTTAEGEAMLPERFEFKGNYPNPFNSETTLEFTLPSRADVTLDLYSMEGRLVRRLVEGEMTPGIHRYLLDASDLASGVYVAALQAGDDAGTHKMIHLK